MLIAKSSFFACTFYIIIFTGLNKANINFIWDIAHTVVHEETVEESYDYLESYLKHVHIKDFKKIKSSSSDGDDPYSLWERFVPPGKGNFPLRQFIKLLQQKNYKGVICLETPASYANAEQCLQDLVCLFEESVKQ